MAVQKNTIESMTATEYLRQILKNDSRTVITVGRIKDGKSSWAVYGRDGVELSPELRPYAIASITKTITSALISRAILEHKISLDDRIDKYLDLPARYYPTVLELLTHTAGYKSLYNPIETLINILSKPPKLRISRENVLERLGKIHVPENEKPWRYSNFGYAVLGMILEKIYGKTYTELVDEFMLEQGMVNSHISKSPDDPVHNVDWRADDANIAAGGVVSNIEDMLIYAKHQLNEDEPYATTHGVLKEIAATKSDLIRMDAMGMAWIIDKKRNILWHSGGLPTYCSYMGFHKDTNTALVVLTNLGLLKGNRASILGVKILEELQ